MYYQEASRMYRWLDSTLRKESNLTESEVIYKATSNFQIGEILVKKRLKLLLEIGKIEIKGDKIVWKG